MDLWTSLTTTTVQEHTHHDGHQKCTQDSKHRPEIVENTTRLGGTIGTDELCLVYKMSCLLEVHFVGSNVSKIFQMVIVNILEKDSTTVRDNTSKFGS